jgi:hypothetical protein
MAQSCGVPQFGIFLSKVEFAYKQIYNFQIMPIFGANQPSSHR